MTGYTSSNSTGRLQHLHQQHPSKLPEYDATKFGPISPQPYEDTHGYYAVSKDAEVPIPSSAYQDEFELLNLTVTRPSIDYNSSKPLPVAVFIHGGSNGTGSVANYLYDPRYLVSRSTEINRPIITVGLQYRLGSLGFMCVGGHGNWAYMINA